MKNDKRITVIRIGLFLLLAFLPAIIIQIVASDSNGNYRSVTASETMMFFPALANIAARLLTKEGLEESYLKINIKGHRRYYIAALVLPLIMGVVEGAVFVIMKEKNYSLSDAIKVIGGGKVLVGTFLILFCTAIAQFYKGFGEEFGWRGYLTPKLEKLMPEPAAVVLTGILWGLWHAPMIAQGYNFGRDYKGFPVLGIVLMCVSCIFNSIILTYLTKKTGSVYPAAILHIVLDVMMSTVAMIIISDPMMIEKYDFLISMILMIYVPAVAAIVTAGIAVVSRIKGKGKIEVRG